MLSQLRHSRRFFSTSTKKAVGFIGLGQMGSRMSVNLLKKGHSLVLYDVNTDAAKHIQSRVDEINRDVEKAGLAPVSVKIVKAPVEVAAETESIVTMLPSCATVRAAYSDKSTGIFNALKGGRSAFMIDCSTIDPSTIQGLSKEAHQISKSISLIDAPVSGGVGGAEAGTLSFMIGGTPEEYERSKLILALMGKNLVHCGSVGMGQSAKICNNVVLGMAMASLSEGMALGVKLGLDPKILANILNTSSGRSWSSEVYNPVPDVVKTAPASRNYEGGFATFLMRKDLGLALKAAENAGQYMPIANLTTNMYDEMIGQVNGNDKKDFSYIYQHVLNHKK